MTCVFCGGGDKWIKTCRTKGGSRLRLCDPCYEELSEWFVIVPGDVPVAARCDSCWCYGNPREYAEVTPGGRGNAYSGVCGSCASG
jgi:hypothetical protein